MFFKVIRLALNKDSSLGRGIMEPIRIQYTTQEADVRKCSQIICEGINKSTNTMMMVALGVALAITVALSTFLVKQEAYEQAPPIVKSCAYIFPLLFSFIFTYSFLARYFPPQICHPQGAYLSSKELVIDDEGLHSTDRNSAGTIKWDGILSIDERNEYILFYVDLTAAIFIPKHSFASPAGASDFAAQARMLWQAARIKAREQAATSSSPWQQAKTAAETPDAVHNPH